MFGIMGLYTSASGAIQGHHGTLVPKCFQWLTPCCPAAQKYTCMVKDRGGGNVIIIYLYIYVPGYGVTDDCLNLPCQYNLSLTLDTKLASILVSTFGYDRNVSALSAFGPLGNSYGIPLRYMP